MHNYYKRNSEIVSYKLVTDPLEAIYWSTYRLKKSDVVLETKFDRSTTAEIKQEIFDDIISREPNPSKKSATSNDEVSQRRKTPKPQYVETGKTKQKARG
jgi:hypothetical protein